MKLTSKDLDYLAKNPFALATFQRTGRFKRPGDSLPVTPLLALLRQLSPRDLGLIRDVTLGPSLGFQPTSRRFAHAGHLKHWLEDPYHGPSPGSVRQGFRGLVTLEDLLDAARHAPELKHFSRYQGRLPRRAQRDPVDNGPTP